MSCERGLSSSRFAFPFSSRLAAAGVAEEDLPILHGKFGWRGETSSESVGPLKSSVRNVKVDPLTVPMGWIVLVGLAALPFQRPIAVETVGRHLFRVL